MQITTIGLDIAKNVFQVHGIDAAEKVVVRKQLRRGQVLKFFAALAPCLVGMEACASAHYWARELTKLGHEVRLMPAKDVKAYVKRHKNDAVVRGRLRGPAEQELNALGGVRLLPYRHATAQLGADSPWPCGGVGRRLSALLMHWHAQDRCVPVPSNRLPCSRRFATLHSAVQGSPHCRVALRVGPLCDADHTERRFLVLKRSASAGSGRVACAMGLEASSASAKALRTAQGARRTG